MYHHKDLMQCWFMGQSTYVVVTCEMYANTPLVADADLRLSHVTFDNKLRTQKTLEASSLTNSHSPRISRYSHVPFSVRQRIKNSIKNSIRLRSLSSCGKYSYTKHPKRWNPSLPNALWVTLASRVPLHSGKWNELPVYIRSKSCGLQKQKEASICLATWIVWPWSSASSGWVLGNWIFDWLK